MEGGTVNMKNDKSNAPCSIEKLLVNLLEICFVQTNSFQSCSID